MAKKTQDTEPVGEELTKKDTFLEDIYKMSKEDTAIRLKESVGMANYEEPSDEGALVMGSTFWNWRDSNDRPHIGKVFVGRFIGPHEKPEDSNSMPGELLGYDFKGADGVDYILGDNYSLSQALNTEHATGKLVKDLSPKPVLWIKLLAVDPSKKGDFNRFKIKLVNIEDYKS